jgi:hypothetical protein
MVNSSSVSFDLNTRVQTSYIDDYLLIKETYQMKKIMPLVVEGVDLDLRMRGFEFAHIASSIPFDSPRPLHLKASGRVKFQGKIMKSSNTADGNINGVLQSNIDQNKLETNVSKLVGDISLSGIKLNQLMLAPQSTGFLSISRDSVMVISYQIVCFLWSSSPISSFDSRLFTIVEFSFFPFLFACVLILCT